MTSSRIDDTLERRELEHEWWDPGEKFPKLQMISKTDGSIILCCKKCMVIKGTRSTVKPCPGVARIELR